MKSEAFYNNLSDDLKRKLSECKTEEDVRSVLADAGIEPLDSDLLASVSGGAGRAPLIADLPRH